MSYPKTSENPRVSQEVGLPAVVTVEDINFTDDEAKFTTSENDTSIWTDFQIRNRYEKDPHKYMIGLTSPNGFKGKCVGIVQLAAPTLLWICEWTACRYAEPPDIPDPDVQDPSWILIDEYYETFKVGVAADGVTPLYRISGAYVYAHTCPDDVTVNNMNYPRTPELQDVFDRSVQESTFKQNLSNVTGGNLRTRGPGGE